MIERPRIEERIRTALRRAPVTALLGPRQCGKTTLARAVATKGNSVYLDMESPGDLNRLANAQLFLGSLRGLVIIDEVQLRPDLFALLRVLVDRAPSPARFLILGSASPALIRNASESLAGRVEFIEMGGFDADEAGAGHEERLWLRGGFPRSFLARSNNDSLAWRENFIRTFLQRDIPQLGIDIPPLALRRFWTMVAHYHGQVWNAAEIGAAMSLSDKTVRRYLDLLTETYMLRQLQPWHANLGKRQVKSPKVYLRDSGILHSLLGLPDKAALWGHPKVGASWEGFAIEMLLRALDTTPAYFWSTHSGAEMDLFFSARGRNYGVEVKWTETPRVTRSMRVAVDDLQLDRLWVLYPGADVVPLDEGITALPLTKLVEIPSMNA